MADFEKQIVLLLVRRVELLNMLISLNQDQIEFFNDEKNAIDGLEVIYDKKDELLLELDQLETDLTKALEDNVSNKDSIELKEDIKKEVSELIDDSNDKSQQLARLESESKKAFEKYVSNNRADVKNGRQASNAAMNYFRTQSQFAYSDSHYMDKKK